MSLRCCLFSPKEMEQHQKHLIKNPRFRCSEKSAEENKFWREQGPVLPHFWVQFPPDLGSSVHKLPPGQNFHCSGREDAVARRELSWVPEIFSVILWETEWFDRHRYWWKLMENLLSQCYIPGRKICVSAFAQDAAQLHWQSPGINQLLQQTPKVSTLLLTHIS